MQDHGQSLGVPSLNSSQTRNPKVVIGPPKLMSCLPWTNQAKSLLTAWRRPTLEIHTQRESLLNKDWRLAGLRNLHRAKTPHFHC
jgi:hypothetical protein